MRHRRGSQTFRNLNWSLCPRSLPRPLGRLAAGVILFAPRRVRNPRSFISYLRHLGAVGLFFLAILDSSPLPTFGGADILVAVLAARHRDPWWEYALVTTVGSVLGAYLTFRLARRAGSAYLDSKFKGGRVAGLLRYFERWGTGTLAASTAIPLPFPTSVFFAAAGASDYSLRLFLTVVSLARAFRYFAITLIAFVYGRQFVRVLSHPARYWEWLLLFVLLTIALIVGGIVLNKRLAAPPKANLQPSS